MAEVNTAKRRSKKERGGAKSKMMAKRGDPARQVLSHLQEGCGSRQMRHCSASCTFLQSRSCCAWGLGREDVGGAGLLVAAVLPVLLRGVRACGE